MRFLILTLVLIVSCTEMGDNMVEKNTKNEQKEALLKVFEKNGFKEKDVEFIEGDFNREETIQFQSMEEFDKFLYEMKKSKKKVSNSFYSVDPFCDYKDIGSHTFLAQESLIGNFVYLNVFCAYNVSDNSMSNDGFTLEKYELSLSGLVPTASVLEVYKNVYSLNNVVRFSGYGAVVYKASIAGVDVGPIVRDNFSYDGYYNHCTNEKVLNVYDMFN